MTKIVTTDIILVLQCAHGKIPRGLQCMCFPGELLVRERPTTAEEGEQDDVGAEERLERRGCRRIGRGGDRHLLQGGQVTDRYRKKDRMRDKDRRKESMRERKIG
jgi:hypothetical protein